MKNFYAYLSVLIQSVITSPIKCLAFIFLMLFFCSTVSATHIIGGSISYEHQQGDVYTIRLEVMRDCYNGNPNAYFDDPASVGIFDENNNLVEHLLIPFSGIDDTLGFNGMAFVCILPPDICIHRTIYEQEVTLPPLTGGYTITYQRCCRNFSLSNIDNPGMVGMTFFTHLDSTVPNSSPQFNSEVPISAQVDVAFAYNGAATDPDGDSLAYEMVAPFVGASGMVPMPQPPASPPYDMIQYVDPPYSVDNMIGGDYPLKIHPKTGVMSTIPPFVGAFQIAYAVKEYRDGQLIGTTYREFMFFSVIGGGSPFNMSGDILTDNATPLEVGSLKMYERVVGVTTDTLDLYETQELNSINGAYEFTNVPLGTFYLKAMIDETSILYDDYLPAYFQSVPYWYQAEAFNQCVLGPLFRDIYLLESQNTPGSFYFEGTVRYGNSAGDPVPNLDLILAYENGDLVQARTTNAQGYFKFENLSANNYKLMADLINSNVLNCFPPAVNLNESTAHSVFLLPDRLIVDQPTGVKMNEANTFITAKVFPNPASDKLWITFDRPANDLNLIFYNSIGVAVKSILVSSERTIELPLTDFSDGVYFIAAEQNSNQNLLEKLVLIR